MNIELKNIRSDQLWLEDCAKFIMKRIFTASELGKVSVTIGYLPARDSGWGDCHWVDHTATAKIRLSRTQICPVGLASTLAHELVHAEQFYSYRLMALRDDRWLWEGEIRKSVPGSRANWNMPWEKEAREREKDLVKEWLTHRADNC